MSPLEQEVREMLRSKVQHAPGRDEPPPEILRRARRSRVVTVAIATLAIAGVVVGILGGIRLFGTSTPFTTGPVVGWKDLPVSPIGGDIPFDLSAPKCRASDVALDVQFKTSSGSYVEFTNKKSGGRCQLNVFATVSSLKIFEGQRDLGVIGNTNFGHPGFLVTATPHIIYFHWNSYCGPPLSEERWEMTLPGGRISSEAGETVPPCLHLRSGINFAQAAFDPGVSVPSVAFLRPFLHAPRSVRAGQLLVYRVTLRNSFGGRVAFGPDKPCPNYHEALDGEVLLDRAYQLNCDELGSVAPGKSIAFEMRLLVPTTMPPGTYTLRWGFQIDRFFPGADETTIRVTG